jgi:hypothetical protein
MKRLDGIIVTGETLSELCRFHYSSIAIRLTGRFPRWRFEKVLCVMHRKGFSVRFTYAKIGDTVYYYGDTNVAVPKDLKSEFRKGWMAYESESVEPFAEYYEEFMRNHKVLFGN